MSVLSDFEDRVSRAVEGVFAGVFRAPVQPAELAKAAGKEMDRRRKLGVGKVYVPTLYSVLLSPADGDQLGGFSATLAGELETYLIGYAREHDYQLSTRPRVRFLVDDGLKLGRFEIIGELLSAEEIAAELKEGAEAEARGAASASAEPAAPGPLSGAAAAPAAATPVAAASVTSVADALAVPGVFDADVHAALAPSAIESSVTIRGIDQKTVLTGDRYIIGRLKACDICLQDANASREHAALECESDGGWALADLHSTNGTLVNGVPVDRVRLRDGDLITIGITELVYHETRS